MAREYDPKIYDGTETDSADARRHQFLDIIFEDWERVRNRVYQVEAMPEPRIIDGKSVLVDPPIDLSGLVAAQLVMAYYAAQHR